jgi:hypothetical protein
MLPWRLSWSSCRHEDVTQVAEKSGKTEEKAENEGESGLRGLASTCLNIPLATPLARFGKIVWWLLTRRAALTMPFVVSPFQSFQRLEESAFARS